MWRKLKPIVLRLPRSSGKYYSSGLIERLPSVSSATNEGISVPKIHQLISWNVLFDQAHRFTQYVSCPLGCMFANMDLSFVGRSSFSCLASLRRPASGLVYGKPLPKNPIFYSLLLNIRKAFYDGKWEMGTQRNSSWMLGQRKGHAFQILSEYELV
jgi:hypothetical protein